MRTPLSRVARDQERVERDRAIGEAMRRLRLALAEVKVVERRSEGVVTSRAVVNKDAIGRARRAYLRACLAVGKARQADATTMGPQHPDRVAVSQATAQLASYQRELAELEAL